MSDTNGADRSDGNDSYIDWLEATWNSVSSDEPTAPEETPFVVPYPVMGYLPWQMHTYSVHYIKGFMRGIKYGLCMLVLIGGLLAGWQLFADFVNFGMTGFGR